MEPADHWIPDDVAQWLDHIGIHQPQQSIDMLYGEFTQTFPTSIMQNDAAVAGPVLQRLMQENLRFVNGVSSENDSMASSSSPASTETMPLETQPRQEPQGQEHQVDSCSMEKNAKGVQNTPASVQMTLAVSGLGDLELPSYEEAKNQSLLFKGQQGQNEPSYTNLQNAGNTLASLTSLQTPSHATPNLQSTGLLPQNHSDQTLSIPNQSQSLQTPATLKPSLQQGALVSYAPSSTSSCPPSLSSAPSLSSCTRTESRTWVQRGFTGGDEGLSELKQGHVRSLSDRIMQLSLERNGGRQHRETIPSGAELLPNFYSLSKSAAPSAPDIKGSLEPRGPPPEYPFKPKAHTTYPSSMSPGPLSLDPTLLVMEASPGQISSLMPPCQTVPVFAQAGSGTRLPPQGQIVPVDALSMMGQAQHTLSILSNENQRLRQELLVQTEKTGKLQRLEAELQRLSDAYESLVRSSSKRETLDKTMRVKLEGEIRRLHDFNRDLRDRLETANRQLANPDTEGQEDNVYLTEKRENLKELERLEAEAESLRSANEDQRRHIEILEQALNNAQSKVVRLEEELGKKNVYVERVERLQHALGQLQAACEKQFEKRLRTRLERELETLRSQQRAGVGVCESSTPALLDLLREREERILGLEADRMRWEQKYLEESAMRQFAMDAAATAAAQRDTTIIHHSRSSSYSDACLWQHDRDDKAHNHRCQDIETRMKDLHAQLLEKIATIKMLQQRSRRDSASLRPARSVPSITTGTGLHSRQASQTESGLIGREGAEHLPPSLLSFTPSVSSLPPSYPSLSVSTLPLPSILTSSSVLPLTSSSSLPSSSATLPLPSTYPRSLPPLPPNVSSSLPSTPLLSLHSKLAGKDGCTQTKRSTDNVRGAPPTGRSRMGKTDSPFTQMKSTDTRSLPVAGQKIRPPDSDLVEILI